MKLPKIMKNSAASQRSNNYYDIVIEKIKFVSNKTTSTALYAVKTR